MKKIILRNEPDTKSLAKQCAIHNVVCCAKCKEQELIEEMQREQYLHDLHNGSESPLIRFAVGG